MERIYALIKNNKVVNSIVANSIFISKISTSYDAIIRVDQLSTKPGIGWSYDGINFSPADGE